MAANGMSNWYRLTPDIHGSYVNGTWSAMASMNASRLYFASVVLRDGRVLVAGAEYGTGYNSAEVYDPLTDTWTLTSGADELFFDAISEILPDGRVMVAPLHPTVPGTPAIYDPVADIWSTGPAYCQDNGPVVDQEEASWVKLPDDTILTVDPIGYPNTNSERFIPSLGQWLCDAPVPVELFEGNEELGPALLLPNTNALYLGANGHTALYTPSGSTNLGSWSAGPDIPDGLAAQDAPMALMVNGKVLCALSASQSSSSTSFYEYDPMTNGFSEVDGPFGQIFPMVVYGTRMLDLPDGTVLFSASMSLLFVYQPDGAPLDSGKPVITSITTNADGSYLLTGTGLNGISAGAAYGDDAQMDSNYPLVRMTDTSSNVYYARTFNWSSTGVMTGTNLVTTQFTLPTNLPPATYSLVAVANGISSDPVVFPYGSPPMMIQSVAFTNGGFTLSWNSAPGQTFHVQYLSDFTQTNWLDLLGTITATNTFTTATDTNVDFSIGAKFYRVVSP